MKNKITLALTSSAILGTLLFSGVASAQTIPNPPANPGGWGTRGVHAPGVRGTVSAISGDILTVTSKGFGPNSTSATYTVDATNATITKNGTASSLASVSVGDMIAAQGTVSGTNVVATKIRDGMMMGGGKGMGGKMPWTGQNAAPGMEGNGQPVIGGSVTAITGSTLTLTNKSNVTYTVDATNATITLADSTSTIASVKVGDSVMVQGTVNGTSVTAVSVSDRGVMPTAAGNTSTGSPAPHMGGLMGMFGGFFQHLFGFF